MDTVTSIDSSYITAVWLLAILNIFVVILIYSICRSRKGGKREIDKECVVEIHRFNPQVPIVVVGSRKYASEEIEVHDADGYSQIRFRA